MLPLSVDLTDRLVLCVGAGPVAARRIATFREAGARVRVVAPERCGEVAGQPHEWVAREVRESDLDEVWFVHSATGDPAVDREVAAWARERQLFCITAGRASDGSAALPARRTLPTPDGTLTVAITSADPRRSVRLVKSVARWLAGQDLRPARDRRPLVPCSPRHDTTTTAADAARSHEAVA